MSRRNNQRRNDNDGNSANRFQFDILQQFFSCFRDSNDGNEDMSRDRLNGRLCQPHNHGRGMKQNQKRRNQRRVLINRSMIGYPMDFRHTGHLGSDDLPFNLDNIESVINNEDTLRLQIQMQMKHS